MYKTNKEILDELCNSIKKKLHDPTFIVINNYIDKKSIEEKWNELSKRTSLKPALIK